MRGGTKRPKSTAQRLIDGSRKRPHHHPQPVIDGDVRKPKLTKAAGGYWDYFEPILSRAKMLTPGDRESLRLYCIALSQVDDIERQQQAKAYRRVLLTTTIDGAGNERVRAETNPLDQQMRNWIEIARHHGAELGLSPTSRTRVTPTGKPSDDEKPSALAKLQGMRIVPRSA